MSFVEMHYFFAGIIISVYEVILVLLHTCILKVADTKDCYVCTNNLNIQQCTNTVRCPDGKSCYQNVTISGQQILYNLGCVENAQCVLHNPISNMIVGRSNDKRQTQNCLECCSSDLCNNNLCNHTQPSVCMDDESLDCARLSTLFNVCNDVHQAKTTCPKFCGLCNLVDGNWGTWTDWSACDVTCENGTETRTRTCSNPSPAHGGLDCQGQSLEVKTCQKPLCPVHGRWSGWSSWGTCSESCGVGLQERTRNCSNPAPQRFGDHCFGKNADMMICMSYTCAAAGWSDWSAWSSCYSSDGKSGTRSRYRECNNPPPSPFGKPCRGLPMQLSLCLVTVFDCSSGLNGNVLNKSGVYNVTLWKSRRNITVYCDMDTDGGGWTVFQSRFNMTTRFHQTFSNYEHGFGSPSGEFWLGLDYVQEMTTRVQSELRIEVTDVNGTFGYEAFQNFTLSPSPDYTLHISEWSGNIGNNTHGLRDHNNTVFSTYDNDRDLWASNCGAIWEGGWWYNDCLYVDLNSDRYHGPVHYTFTDNNWVALASSKMMFREVQMPFAK